MAESTESREMSARGTHPRADISYSALSSENVLRSDHGAYGTGDEDAELDGIGVGSGACPFP